MEIRIVFLNDLIEEEVYIEKPHGFEVHGRESHVCGLKKALYVIKQALRAKYTQIDSYMTRLGFSKSDVYLNLYLKVKKNEHVILLLYVDELVFICVKHLIIQSKMELASEFDKKDFGFMHYCLGLEVWQKPGEIFIAQGKYIIKILF